MKGRQDIESYLLRLGTPYEAIGEEMWNLHVQEDQNLVVSLADTLVVFRLKVMETPQANRESFFETLLKLNTTEMMHGAFGLENGAVVIVAALALENLDFNEFQSSIDDIAMSVGKLYPTLSRFRDAA